MGRGIARLKGWLRRDDADAAAGASDRRGPPPLRVLMVCMGNICRSPIAEGVLRAKLAQAGLQQRVVVDSAGTHGFHTKEPPDPRSIRHAALRGYDIAALRARPVVDADFGSHHLLVAMDVQNLQWLQKHAPPRSGTGEGQAAAGPEIGLLLAHAQRYTGVREVPDPYYGGPEGFERVLDLVEDGCEGLLGHLRVLLAAREAEGRSGRAPARS